MTYDMVACQTFAGGMDVGMTWAGFELVHKVEQLGGFGMKNCLANRHVLGDRWDWQATDPNEWEPVPAHVLTANPPCSGFSLMSNKEWRGINSPVNACMWATMSYAARIQPYVVIMESVQQAFTGGLELMRGLRKQLETDTGQQWDMYHVLQNAASVGGCSIRKRYFLVLSRIPFGIEMPDVTRVPVLDEVIGDLEKCAITWEAQPYRAPASWWTHELLSPSGLVDGHMTIEPPNTRRCLDLMDKEPWGPRESMEVVARRYYANYGHLPASWPEEWAQRQVEKNFNFGYNQPVRWAGNRVARVVTGGAMGSSIHPHEPRMFTHRECARILGFPDDWKIHPLRGTPSLHATWGKGVSTHCGKWIGEWAAAALDGTPGSHTGEPMEEEREFKIDVTRRYRAVCAEN